MLNPQTTPWVSQTDKLGPPAPDTLVQLCSTSGTCAEVTLLFHLYIRLPPAQSKIILIKIIVISLADSTRSCSAVNKPWNIVMECSGLATLISLLFSRQWHTPKTQTSMFRDVFSALNTHSSNIHWSSSLLKFALMCFNVL